MQVTTRRACGGKTSRNDGKTRSDGGKNRTDHGKTSGDGGKTCTASDTSSSMASNTRAYDEPLATTKRPSRRPSANSQSKNSLAKIGKKTQTVLTVKKSCRL